MAGWIKLHRRLLEWEWYSDVNTTRLFIHLLLTVCFKETRDKGCILLPGQRKFNRKELAEECGLSEQNVRTCIARLKSTNEITIKSTNKYSLLTIVKYEEYQGEFYNVTNKSTGKLTNNQPATNQHYIYNEEERKEGKEEREAHAHEVFSDFSGFEYFCTDNQITCDVKSEWQKFTLYNRANGRGYTDLSAAFKSWLLKCKTFEPQEQEPATSDIVAKTFQRLEEEKRAKQSKRH